MPWIPLLDYVSFLIIRFMLGIRDTDHLPSKSIWFLAILNVLCYHLDYLQLFISMKRVFYISLMMILGILLTVCLYYCIIFGIISNRLIHFSYVDYFLDMTLSPAAIAVVALIGALCGHRAGKQWWQIIYVDGVYYFNKALKPRDTRAPIVPRRQRTIRKTHE